MKHKKVLCALCVLLSVTLLLSVGCVGKQVTDMESIAPTESVADVSSDASAGCKVLRILDLHKISEVLKQKPVRTLELPEGVAYSELLVRVMERVEEDVLIEIHINLGDFYEYPYLYHDICEETYLTNEEILEKGMRTVYGDEEIDYYLQRIEETFGRKYEWTMDTTWWEFYQVGMPADERCDDRHTLIAELMQEQTEQCGQQVDKWMEDAYLESFNGSLAYLHHFRGSDGYGLVDLRLTVAELLELAQFAWLYPRSGDGQQRNYIELQNELKLHID